MYLLCSLLFTKENFICENSKQKKKNLFFCDLITIICFVFHTGEFSVREFSAAKFSRTEL